MSKITYNAQSLKIMSLFEKTTRARLKDYFVDDNDLMTFVVHEVQLGKAIGKQAANVKKLEHLLKRKIKILGFNPNPVKFTQNVVYPLKVLVNLEENVITIEAQDTKTKAFLIGRNQSNLKNNLKVIQKYFKEIKELKVN